MLRGSGSNKILIDGVPFGTVSGPRVPFIAIFEGMFFLVGDGHIRYFEQGSIKKER
jgi:hypothetical protein